jgi:hypothetical protein
VTKDAVLSNCCVSAVLAASEGESALSTAAKKYFPNACLFASSMLRSANDKRIVRDLLDPLRGAEGRCGRGRHCRNKGQRLRGKFFGTERLERGVHLAFWVRQDDANAVRMHAIAGGDSAAVSKSHLAW